jgi:hypothetical protein
VKVLATFVHPRCEFCNGNGKVVHEDDGRKLHAACPACGGTGEKPLAREVPRVHIEAAEWLMLQIKQQAVLIHRQMARTLSNQVKEIGL